MGEVQRSTFNVQGAEPRLENLEMQPMVAGRDTVPSGANGRHVELPDGLLHMAAHLMYAPLRSEVPTPGDEPRTQSAERGTENAEPRTRERAGQWRLAWRRFGRHRLALVGAAAFLAMCALALVGPSISPTMPPGFALPSVVSSTPGGQPGSGQPLSGGQTLTLAQVEEMSHIDTAPQLWPFHWRYALGTDSSGVPVLMYILLGAAPTLAIGVFGSLLASLLGIVIGGIAGFVGSIVDPVLMRLTDAFLTVPFLPLLMVLSVFLTDHSVLTYVVIFALTGWPAMARLVRGYALSLREREYVQAARALGVSDPGIIFRHIIPNIAGVVVVSFTLNIALFIVAEAGVEFIASGPDAPTWGRALALAATKDMAGGYWWTFVFPSLALLLTVLSVNLLGDGLRDALDSTSRVPVDGGRGRVGRMAGFVMAPVAGSVLPRVTRGARVLQGGFAASVRTGRMAVHAPRVVGWPAGRMQYVPPRRYSGRLTWPTRRLGIWGRIAVGIGPVIATLVAVGLVFLYGHSPLNYAPNYPPPVRYAAMSGPSEYGAQSLPHGGWTVFGIDAGQNLTNIRLDVHDRIRERQVVARGATGLDQPSLALSGTGALGVWVADHNGALSLQGAFFGSGRPKTFTVVQGGAPEHPFVFTGSHGGFDVVFSWLRSNRYDVYLASIPASAARPAFVRRIVRAPDYGFYPRAATDGSDHIDVLYFARCCQHALWQVMFRRYTAAGTPVDRPRVLDSIQGRFTATLHTPIVPTQWGLDVQRAPDGSVWAAWVDDVEVMVAHWSVDGRALLPSTQVAQGLASSALSLAPGRYGGSIIGMGTGSVHAYPEQVAFDGRGHMLHQERVAYDLGGSAYNPHAGVVAGRPVVIWQKDTANGQLMLEGTRYRAAVPPTLLTRLGLNIGNLWANLLLIVLGSLGGGVALAAVNAALIVILVAAWLVIRRIVPPPLQWWLYAGAIGGLLTWAFALSTAAPGIVFIVPAMVAPYGWLAVGAAVFVSTWSGRFLLRNLDPSFRAVAMAAVAVYVVAALYLVTVIQAEVGQV